VIADDEERLWQEDVKWELMIAEGNDMLRGDGIKISFDLMLTYHRTNVNCIVVCVF
jgi:hypothetical protein